ncbi:MAG: 50S ribosomal protein L32e [Candidatus Aramenus sulfurataquae]|jgi:large subunit ribosomal protein L32e|uniref:Large ribosomal subunit protein eL32 n=2 Tax=Candidatus Aramenus sulfurataquae TaxID=1326980 RepID=W7KVM8_9CREN|nr:MAG: 50S ribosomal protein L32e [Candidatus Aramenus sulfurataquae]MCL7343300.1 50S ribosomal protein L32e [Candidatus Aramenus sulfurataquae]
MVSTELKRIQRLRAIYKSRKPEFLRYDWDKYFRLERQETWRRPRGIDNKTRLHLKGFPKLVSSGYIKPKEIRYRHPSGLEAVYVRSINDLDKIPADKRKSVIAILSGNIGLKKKAEIIKKASEYGIRVANGGA